MTKRTMTIYVLERGGQHFRVSDKMAAAAMMLRQGYMLVAQIQG